MDVNVETVTDKLIVLIQSEGFTMGDSFVLNIDNKKY